MCVMMVGEGGHEGDEGEKRWEGLGRGGVEENGGEDKVMRESNTCKNIRAVQIPYPAKGEQCYR